MSRSIRTRWAVPAVVGALALAGCAGAGSTSGGTASPSGGSAAPGGTVVLVTHDSFALPDALISQFESDTGLTLDVRAQGDAGAMVNQLVLTKDAPIGDAVFGIDNTFASRAVDAGVLAPYQATLPDSAKQYTVGDSGELTPIDVGDVCVNADLEWFSKHDLAVPSTLEDLTKPEYKGLLAVENPATSSPGLAFLLATVGAFGADGWQGYWQELVANDVQVASSWSDAYYVDFSGPSSDGDKPLVVSYASSPPDEVPDGATSAPTTALLNTCFRQVEYAGVLAGAANPDGAKKVVDWLLSPAVQAAIPESMYMYPVDSSVALPTSWTKYAPLATKPFSVSPAEITAHRDDWIQAWTSLVVG
ncbi:thiamine ABC transporter substrate-binding protein [Isoptericola sp. b441]|uniref:Thiamine ABC transporter substrate-binding protein n=1 Tax=Actinotalea lenta TaxID=3064654 RepID=A0ABT9D630_9CELL|nr:thiamine ABC transporter substrate-binding protein [Isoptericola sp. b441]MDO8106279.1 thiamine ABC transporter substrate-binding protein [Isoptericola sp. b441]